MMKHALLMLLLCIFAYDAVCVETRTTLNPEQGEGGILLRIPTLISAQNVEAKIDTLPMSMVMNGKV